MNYEEVTPTFLALSAGPVHIKNDDIAVLEQFTILLYDHSSSINNVAQDRQEFFTKKGRAMDVTPTKTALVQHIIRAAYHGGQCWGKMLQISLNMPTPDNWGSNHRKLL